MIWETTISYVTIGSNGADKSVKEKYIINTNDDLFGGVENLLIEKFGTLTGFSICDIKHSKAKEIANKQINSDDLVWRAEVQDTFVGEDGEEKHTKYIIVFFAQTFDTAKAFISEYLRQGYNLELVGLKLTKFIDVL